MIVNFSPLLCHLLLYDFFKMSLFNGSLCVNNAELPALAAKFGSASLCSLAYLTHAHTHTLVIIAFAGLRSLTSSLSTSFTSRCDSLPTSWCEVTIKLASREKSRIVCPSGLPAFCTSVFIFLFFWRVQNGSSGPSLSIFVSLFFHQSRGYEKIKLIQIFSVWFHTHSWLTNWVDSCRINDALCWRRLSWLDAEGFLWAGLREPRASCTGYRTQTGISAGDSAQAAGREGNTMDTWIQFLVESFPWLVAVAPLFWFCACDSQRFSLCENK